MHELAIAQSLLKIVEQEALPFRGARVTRIKLRIGKLSAVVPDALRFAFEVISQGGIAEGASLEIEEVPLRLRCHQCKEVFVVEGPFLICPHCEGLDVEMVSGRELEIKSMEIEDGN
ncbi:MAG: hydrogenase maturation nickel metallochaperone HypA [Deltaproteobacteria bacterium]|mgnify:CR=1 FL=1|nr:MAG: hydrogenase maturation nickel metallochaperone HypA [Deltaproteobacteria bacterium]